MAQEKTILVVDDDPDIVESTRVVRSRPALT